MTDSEAINGLASLLGVYPGTRRDLLAEQVVNAVRTLQNERDDLDLAADMAREQVARAEARLMDEQPTANQDDA